MTTIAPSRFMASIMALLLTTFAAGQGAEQHFPGPMSWATLRQQLDRLPPAQAQWADLEAAHTLYLVEMEDLRTGPITHWLDANSNSMIGFSDDLSALQTALRQRDVILNRIASIDDDYFIRAATIMGDEQQLALERLRLRRARARLVTERHATPLMGFELADHVDPQLLDQDMQGMLYDWEDRRTTLLQAHVQARRTQQLALTKMAASWSSQMEDLRANGDKEAIRAMSKHAQAQARELRVPATKTSQAVSEQAWRGARALADMLPPEDGHEVRMTVVRRLGAQVNEDYQSNMRATGLSTDNDIIQPLLEDYWSDMAGLTNTAATTILALPREDMMFMTSEDMEKNPWQQRFDAMEQAQEPLQNRARRLNNALGALGGPGQPLAMDLARGRAIQAAKSGASMEIIVMSDSGPGTDLPEGSIFIGKSIEVDGGMFDTGFRMSAMLGFTPLPGSLRARLVRDLALDQDAAATLDALIEAHTAALAKSQEVLLASATNAQGHLAFSPFHASTEGRAITQSADDAFFDAAGALGEGDGEAVQWHRLARQRNLAGGSGVMGMISMGMGGAGQAHRADPTEALESSGLEDANITQGLAALDNWHERATAVASSLQSAGEAQQVAFQAQMKRQIAAVDDGRASDVSISVDSSAMQSLQDRIRKAETDLALTNREGLDTLMSHLSEDDAIHVRQAWLIKAYPGAIGKGDPLQASFDTAMQVDGLADAQRGEIAMLRMQHDTQWWTASETIIDELDGSAGLSMLMSGGNQDEMMSAFAAFKRNSEELERKKFTRREAALKQLAALREVLTEAQLEQAGGLPDPVSDQNQHIMQF